MSPSAAPLTPDDAPDDVPVGGSGSTGPDVHSRSGIGARIRDLPPAERPREKLARLGPAALSDAELLALFLRSGTATRSAIELGRHLIERFGSLSRIAACGVEELVEVPGIGPAKASELAAAIELGMRLARERAAGLPIERPEAVHDLLGPEMSHLPQESLRVLLLDTRHRLVQTKEIFRGSLNESVAHPREILRPVIVHSAHAFIVVHNHPSGDPTPSRADRAFTTRLRTIASEMQIDFLDHIIIGRPLDGRDPYFSFRESGLL